MVDLNRVTDLTPDVDIEIEEQYNYHAWNHEMTEHGLVVRNALISAVRAIIKHVPPSPDRSTALRKLREARMDCNSAITHDGKY